MSPKICQKHCCDDVLCCWSCLLTRCCPFALEASQCTSDSCPRALWSPLSPGLLQNTCRSLVECLLPALKNMFPTHPLDIYCGQTFLSILLLSFVGIEGIVPVIRTITDVWDSGSAPRIWAFLLPCSSPEIFGVEEEKSFDEDWSK